MVEVIPAIIAKNFKELKEKVAQVERYCHWVQLDIMDGKFTPRKTWNNPKELSDFKGQGSDVNLEVHLMVKNPFKAAEAWLKNGAQRIIFHWESLGKKPEEKFWKIKEKAKKMKREIGMALNPETSWMEIEKLISQIDIILLMTVHPGFGGQIFLEEVLPKIKSLRQKHLNVKIEVDGGINPETGKKCLEAGADILVSNSYIFESKNIARAIEKLKNL